MGRKISRRQALRRMGSGALGVGLVTMSGIERLARAAAAELGAEGDVGVLATSGCGMQPTEPPREVWYGCTRSYQNRGCDDYHWTCQGSANFQGCEQGDYVYCHTYISDHGFRCWNDGEAYGCRTRDFHCMNQDDDVGAGWFHCRGGTTGNHDFICDDEGADQTFWCFEVKFDCGRYVAC